ncbi:BSD-domain-containing protein [Tothia fuscella]|uniref:BSD-domain-containing protein n=1 Tax=Tothia fuscella TaxID=1048955 RepID=A0A9P4NZ17_9PEZI|nr:BSD-domain-containing protein [Tothia fuscella]
MDVAYDHIQEEVYPEDEEGKKHPPRTAEEPTLNAELQEAYKAVANSPWAARLGGLWGSVKKQGEMYYGEAAKEYTAASSTASKGLTDLIGRTRSLSLTRAEQEAGEASDTPTERATPTSAPSSDSTAHPDRPESLSADIVKEASSIVSRFRTEAAKRLKEVQKAEDAADEALLKFGTNISQFLKEAVTIAAPTDEEVDSGTSKVLFESKDAEGKRVIHTTRFEAQLHVIHVSLDSFLRDPSTEEYEVWGQEFDVEGRTGDIAKDLESYDELRRAMEKLVPEKVEYGVFWKRYYFLRHVIETEEKRRRELLKGASTAPTEQISWDEDSEEEGETPKNDSATTPKDHPSLSTGTLKTPTKEEEKEDDDTMTLKPAEPRKSNDQGSTAGSDASYDIVSGATSKAPGSPDEMPKVEESDEEDWE